MNGPSHLEPPDYSEFVEVDPTGRYGRVHLSLSLSLRVCFFCEMNCEFDFGISFCFFAVQ